jgi:hypothetical protein
MNASLSEKLSAVKWGEFRLTDIFVVKNTSNLLASDIIAGSGETPYLCASSENNAVSSYIKYDFPLPKHSTISAEYCFL